MSYERVMDEYFPHPKLRRENTIILSGLWDYTIIKEKEFNDNLLNDLKYLGKINVPYPIESKLSKVNYSLKRDELLIYHLEFNIEMNDLNTILNFGAIDNHARIYLNNHYIGEHIGGYLAFNFDISDYIKEKNDLYVVVSDKLDYKYPYGKQSKKSHGIWYTKISGIWKSVFIERVPKSYITNIKMDTSVDNQELRLKFSQIGDFNKKISIYKHDELIKEIESADLDIIIKFDELTLWTPETPVLYDILIETPYEKVKSYCNFYKIELKEYNQHLVFHLNDKPYFLHGLLDQGYYEGGIFVPSSIKEIEDDFIIIKHLGFNTLRKHIKVEEEYYYYLCDKMGFLVWQDMVNNLPYSFFFDSALPTIGLKNFSPKIRLYPTSAKSFFTRHCLEIQNQLYNYKCVMLYTIFNEGWGEHNVKHNYELLKNNDPTRFYDVCSGWFKKKYSLFDSRHIYFKPFKVGKIGKNQALILSEFGGYSLYLKNHCHYDKPFGYKKMKDFDEFNQEIRELYFNEIIPALPNGLAACIYTQLSDVENEINGLITYDRQVVKLRDDVASEISKELKFKNK